MSAAKTLPAKRTIGQLIKRLLLLDLFKGLMVTFSSIRSKRRAYPRDSAARLG